ncbi:MAG: hypothetical protein ACK56I_16685, partial [bacterium]
RTPAHDRHPDAGGPTHQDSGRHLSQAPQCPEAWVVDHGPDHQLKSQRALAGPRRRAQAGQFTHGQTAVCCVIERPETGRYDGIVLGVQILLNASVECDYAVCATPIGRSQSGTQSLGPSG